MAAQRHSEAKSIPYGLTPTGPRIWPNSSQSRRSFSSSARVICASNTRPCTCCSATRSDSTLPSGPPS